MNWIKNVVRPKIRGLFEKKESGEALWIKCPQSGELIFHKDLVANQWVVPSSDYHMRIGARERLALFFDHGDYEKIEAAQPLNDPLKFRDQKRYTDRLRDARSKTGMDDSVLAALGNLHGREITVAIHEFAFMGGSMGIAAGAAILAATERACAKRTPLVIFAASGGARMQEGIFSLMQMPRTTVGIRRLRNAGLPYIVVLTNPTTGGVTASYAMLGDVHIAEPGALVGFAGPRVIEQTIREKLPDEFQRSEYLLKHGMVDMVVHRHDLPATVAKICDLLYWRKDLAAADASSAVLPAALLAKDDPLSATANEQEIIPPSAAGE